MSSISSALVLFSGGQDSTVCLAWALSRFDRVETVGFDYGQRHASELAARLRILRGLRANFAGKAARLGEDHLLPLDVLKVIGGSALTDASKIEMGAHGLPTSFVPGRNVMFLTAAAALGYRDCRSETVQATARALSLGLARDVRVHTPLMAMDKAATWYLAEELGGAALVKLIVEETVTCYEGDRSQRHDWGYGCGACLACDLRSAGYLKYTGATANQQGIAARPEIKP